MPSDILLRVSNPPLEVSISNCRPGGLEPSILFCFSISFISSLFELSILEEYLESGLLVIEVKSCPLLPRHIIWRRGAGQHASPVPRAGGTLCGEGKDCCPWELRLPLCRRPRCCWWGNQRQIPGKLGGHRSLK